MVEGTPLLREHLGKTRIEGSNPSVSASSAYRRRYFFLPFHYDDVVHLVPNCVIGYHQISSFLVDRMKDAESCPRTHTASD